MNRWPVAFFALVLSFLFTLNMASGSTDLGAFWKDQYSGLRVQGPNLGIQMLEGPSTNVELLAKATPDECFNGIGVPYPSGPPCSTGIPKVNQAYVWAMTKVGDVVWFGTVANTHCLVLGTFLGLTTPQATDSWVCEFGESQFSPPLAPALGDARLPRVHTFNLTTKTLSSRPADARLASTVGLRAAGNLNNVVLFAGPSAGGINLFAYRADTRAFLGSTTLPAFNSVRTFIESNGALYMGVSNTAGGGSVLRWTGSLVSPFDFELVGSLSSEAAFLTVHEGRLFASTWPSTFGGGGGPIPAGIFMSPLIPLGGLTNAHSGGWTRVMGFESYEPDPVTAVTYGGGALASFDGWLYWGTMHVPFLASLAHVKTFGAPSSNEDLASLLLGTYRAITIFRGRNFDTIPEVEVLYGSPALPRYFPPGPDPVAQPGSWQIVPNGLNAVPVFGPPGIWNMFNNYTWTMAVYDSRLWVGTMDYGYVMQKALPMFLDQLGLDPSTVPDLDLPPAVFGADLFYFGNSASPAIPEYVDGVGNYSNYGIRSMVAQDALYLGMANPMNLMTDLADDRPEGGWELQRLVAKTPNTPAGQHVWVALPNGVTFSFCSVQSEGHTSGVLISEFPDSHPLPPPLPAELQAPPELQSQLSQALRELHAIEPVALVVAGSTAGWRGGCGGGSEATVCIPAEHNWTAKLMQLTVDVKEGVHLKDITTKSEDGRICGAVQGDALGMFVVVQDAAPIPTLSEWGVILLFGLLALVGIFVLTGHASTLFPG